MSAFPEKFADVNKAAVDAALGYSTIVLVARGAGPRALGIYSIAVFAMTAARSRSWGLPPRHCGTPLT